jgi:hypothetical protein
MLAIVCGWGPNGQEQAQDERSIHQLPDENLLVCSVLAKTDIEQPEVVGSTPGTVRQVLTGSSAKDAMKTSLALC